MSNRDLTLIPEKAHGSCPRCLMGWSFSVGGFTCRGCGHEFGARYPECSIDDDLEAAITKVYGDNGPYKGSDKGLVAAGFKAGAKYGRELGKEEGFRLAIEFASCEPLFNGDQVNELIVEGLRLGILKDEK